MAPKAEISQHGLLKSLGRWDVLAVAFGAMVGFGWIVMTGGFLENAGPGGAALAFLVGGVIMGLVGLCYAELCAAMPVTGGEHSYVLRALGSRPGFIVSWSLILGYATVVIYESVALPQSLLYLFPDMLAGHMYDIAGFEVHASWVAVGAGAACLMTVLNYIGIKPAAVAQSIAVIFLLAVGVILLTGSFLGGSLENMKPLFNGGFNGFVLVLVATPFLFVGFDIIPQSAEEIKLPPKRIGRLILVSVAMATAWYIMVMLTVGSAAPADVLSGSTLAAADGLAILMNSQAFGTILVLGGLAGILTSWNGFLIGASRLVFALGRSGMLPEWFGKLHPRFRTPSNAILFIGALSIIAPFFGRKVLVWAVDAGGLTIVVAFLMVALAFIALRNHEPNMPRPFVTPGGKTVGILAAILSLALGVLYLPGMPAALVPQEWIIVGAWWAIGLIFMVRLPKIRPGPNAEEHLYLLSGRTFAEASAPEPVLTDTTL
jgi:amino acid transporter